jgi:hypothetical protein
LPAKREEVEESKKNGEVGNHAVAAANLNVQVQ